MSEDTARSAYILQPDEGDATWYAGCLFDWKAVGDDTAGGFSVVDITFPRGAEPPVHTHALEDEVFYVLEGTILFMVGDQVREAPPGSFVLAPRDVPHGFVARTDTARMLVVFSPAGQERVFHEFSRPAEARTTEPAPAVLPDFDAVEARDREVGVTYLGPPLDPSTPETTGAAAAVD